MGRPVGSAVGTGEAAHSGPARNAQDDGEEGAAPGLRSRSGAEGPYGSDASYGTVSPDGTDASAPYGPADAATEFHRFFELHHAELARLAGLLTGERDAADDLAADALLALWHRWDRVRAADHPAAYARGVVANLARVRIRGAVRERRRIALFWARHDEPAHGPDVPGVLDVQQALCRLPFRKRACVVLRHAFDLSERETARALGVSVGTVKSQTSKGMAELARRLGADGEQPEQPVRRVREAAAARQGTGSGGAATARTEGGGS